MAKSKPTTIDKDIDPRGSDVCASCGEIYSNDELRLCWTRSGTTKLFCEYCISESEQLGEGLPSGYRFHGLEYSDIDQRSYDKLKSAEQNLRDAVIRYLKNCPSTRLLWIEVSHAISQSSIPIQE